MLDRQSVENWWKWAEIEKDGWIEANYLEYHNGKYLRTHTGRTKAIVLLDSLVENYLICVGINPRKESQVGSAKDADITVWKNLYLDLEPIHAPGTNVTEEEQKRVLEFAERVGLSWFLQRIDGDVITANSGNGYHFWVALPPIVGQDAIQDFKARCQTWYTDLLARTKDMRKQYGVRLDHTFSPSRQVKLPGTRKPVEGSRLSSFPCVPRIEAENFKQHILAFPKARQAETVQADIGFTNLSREEIEEKYNLT